MAYRFSKTSEQRLVGLHPSLVKVVRRALEISSESGGPDFGVLEGARSDEQCYINFGKGRTVAQCAAGGCPAKYAQPHVAKVTWLGHALSSNHRKKADGYGHAVDLFPGTWTDTKPYDRMAYAMFQAAKELNVKIRWGYDWDQDKILREKGETDGPHFELLA